MCIYDSILGTGETFTFQMVTAIAVAASIIGWIAIYRRFGVKLEPFVVPIALWIIFGTLDILITVRGTLFNPANEGNPLARLFLETGPFGAAIASILWISLWAGVVLILSKKKAPQVFPLAVFYSLAIGHFSGFSSWFLPLCGLPFNDLFWSTTIRAIVVGFFLAIVHTDLLQRFKKTRKHHL